MSTVWSVRSVVKSAAAAPSKPYICRHCRKTVGVSVPAARRNFASTQTPRQSEDVKEDLNRPTSSLERIRSKLWKGKPPGPENIDEVYGGPGHIQTLIKARRSRRARQPDSSQQLEPQVSAETEAKPSPEAVLETFQEERENRAQLKEKNASIDRKLEALDEELIAQPSTWEGRTWHGLRAVGHQGNWRKMLRKPADRFQPWLRPRIGEKRSYDDLVSLMHRAIINTVTDVEPSNEQMEDLTHAKVSISAHGVPEKVDLPESEVWLEGESIIYTPTDTSFLDARLDLSSPIVFEILENFALLAGRHIPDPVINVLGDEPIKKFLAAFARFTMPKPAKLAEVLLGSQVLAEPSNMKIVGRRETPVDKEIEVGRWKMIQDELQARDLPVLGRAEIRR